MNIKVYKINQSFNDGLNNKSGVPSYTKKVSYIRNGCIFENGNFIEELIPLRNDKFRFFKYNQFGFWFNGHYYCSINVESKDGAHELGIRGTNLPNSFILYLHHKGCSTILRDVMAWVGGVLSIILTIKQIFN